MTPRRNVGKIIHNLCMRVGNKPLNNNNLLGKAIEIYTLQAMSTKV
jgi:hypothetical protein